MVGDVMSVLMVADAESMAVAGDEPSTLVNADEMVEAVDAGRSMVVGEGAGESPRSAPIDEVQPRECPCLRAFDSWSVCGIRRTRRRSDDIGKHRFTQVRPLVG
jgi:hypothetical protein